MRRAARLTLVIDLRSDSIVVAEALAGRDRQAARVAATGCPATLLDPEHAAASGRWLRAWLDHEGFRATRCVVLLPRSMTAFRVLAIPQMGSADVTAAVALQAELGAMRPMESLAWSYVGSVEPAATSGGRTDATLSPLLITAPRERIDAIRNLAREAGLQLAAAVPRGACLAASRRDRSPDAADDSGDAWLISRSGDEIELTLGGADGRLRFGESMRIDVIAPDFPATDLADAARRVVARLRRLTAGGPVNAPALQDLAVLIDVETPLAGAIAETLRSAGVARVACATREFRAILGWLGAAADGAELPDLLEPPRIVQRRKSNAARWAVIAVLVVVGAAWGVIRAQHALDRRIAETAREEQRLRKTLDEGKPARELAALLAEWQSQHIDARSEIPRFVKSLPQTEQLVLDELAISAERNGGRRLLARGSAATQELVMELNQRLLNQSGRYRLQPRALHASTKRTGYPTAFEIDAEIDPASGDGPDDARAGETE